MREARVELSPARQSFIDLALAVDAELAK